MQNWMSKLIVMAFITVFVVAIGSNAEAKKYQEVDAKAVKEMMDGGDTLVVFPLSPIEYDNLHIEDSVNIPLDLLAAELPHNKTKKLVFYCLGVKCVASWRAAEKAVELGYENVYAFREGLPGWVAAGYRTVTLDKLPDVKVKTISVSELSDKLVTKSVVLLDVNLHEDADKFYIDDSQRVHIPLDTLKDRFSELNKTDDIAVLCLKGKRSPTAARFLIGKGFENVSIVEGGIQKWILDGRPVKQGS